MKFRDYSYPKPPVASFKLHKNTPVGGILPLASCHCEMLGLDTLSDTFVFRIRMRRKKGGLLVEITQHQGKIISLGLRKLTTKYAHCLHVEHI